MVGLRAPIARSIMGWWHSIPQREATETLDSVPLILDATFPLNNNLLGPPVLPLRESARALPPFLARACTLSLPMATPPSPLGA